MPPVDEETVRTTGETLGLIGSLNSTLGSYLGLFQKGVDLFSKMFGNQSKQPLADTSGLTGEAIRLYSEKRLAAMESKFDTNARNVANKDLSQNTKSTSKPRSGLNGVAPPLSMADGIIDVYLSDLKHYLPKLDVTIENSHFSALLMNVMKVIPGTNTKDEEIDSDIPIVGMLWDEIRGKAIKHTNATNGSVSQSGAFGVQLTGDIRDPKRKTLEDTVNNVERMKRRRHARYAGFRESPTYDEDYDYVLGLSMLLDLGKTSLFYETMDFEKTFLSFTAMQRNLRANKKVIVQNLKDTAEKVKKIRLYMARLYIDLAVHTSILGDKKRLYDLAQNEPLRDDLSFPLDSIPANTASIPIIARDPNWQITKNTNLQDIHAAILAEQDILIDIKNKLMKHHEEQVILTRQADTLMREGQSADLQMQNTFLCISNDYLDDQQVLAEYLIDGGADLDTFMLQFQGLLDIYIDDASQAYKENSDVLKTLDDQHYVMTTNHDRALDVWKNAVNKSVNTHGITFQNEKETGLKDKSIKYQSMSDVFDDRIRKTLQMLESATRHHDEMKMTYTKENLNFQKTNTTNYHSLAAITQLLQPMLPNVNEYNLEETFSAMSRKMKSELVVNIALNIKINGKMNRLSNALHASELYIQGLQRQISSMKELKQQLIDNMQESIVTHLTNEFRMYYVHSHYLDRHVQLCEAIRMDMDNWRQDVYSDEAKLIRIEMWNSRNQDIRVPTLSTTFSAQEALSTPVLQSGSHKVYASTWNLPIKPYAIK